MQFSKMHGLGNDFMVVDAVTQNVYFPTETIKRLADRIVVLVLISCWWWNRLMIPNWIFIIVFLMRTVVKWRNAVTARVALPVLSH